MNSYVDLMFFGSLDFIIYILTAGILSLIREGGRNEGRRKNGMKGLEG